MCSPLQFCNHQGCNHRFCVVSCCLYSSSWPRAEKSLKKSGTRGWSWQRLTKFCLYLLVPSVYNNGNIYSLNVPHFRSCKNILKFLPDFLCLSRMRKSASSCQARSVTQPPSACSHHVCLIQHITSATLSSSVLNFCCTPFAGDRVKSWNIGNCWQVLFYVPWLNPIIHPVQ